MRRVLSSTICAICLIVVTGCTSTVGRKIDHGKVAQIQKGISTRADVEQLLGRPEQVTITNGMTMLSYSHMVMDYTRSMVPVMGLLAGGANTKNDTVLIMIGADGKVTDVMEGATEQTINTGLLNQNR